MTFADVRLSFIYMAVIYSCVTQRVDSQVFLIPVLLIGSVRILYIYVD